MSIGRIVIALLIFVLCVLFANLSLLVGSWSITHLGSGLDALLLFGMPALLFVMPGLVIRRLAKKREGPTTDRPPSPLRESGNYLLAMGIICGFLLMFACPASAGWLMLRTGEVAESTSIEAALTQHRDAMYISLKDVRVLEGVIGSERRPTSGRSSKARDYAAPIVPRYVSGDPSTPLTREAAIRGHQPLRVWLGAESKGQLAALTNAKGDIGGLVLRGGSYRKAVDSAIAAYGLQRMANPLIIELNEPTWAGALSQESTWGYLGLGVFNLLFVALAGYLWLYPTRRGGEVAEPGEKA